MKRFPQYLSCPYQVLWLETDDMGVFFAFFILALMFGGWFYLLMVVMPFLYGRFKHKYPRGFLKHMLYFTGIINIKRYPTFYENHFVE